MASETPWHPKSDGIRDLAIPTNCRLRTKLPFRHPKHPQQRFIARTARIAIHGIRDPAIHGIRDPARYSTSLLTHLSTKSPF